MNRKNTIVFITVVFIGAALYHSLAIFIHLNDIPLWRQTLFVFINLFFAFAINCLRKYFFMLFIVLFMEQISYHGYRLINWWLQYEKVDWISVLVLLFFLLVFIFLISDHTFSAYRIARQKRKK